MSNPDRLNGSAILRREWRELAGIMLEGLVAGVVVSIVLALAVFIVTTPAIAATASKPSGMLYLEEDGGGRIATPLVFTDAKASACFRCRRTPQSTTNMFFMIKLAQCGRGTYTPIGDVREVQAKMSALFVKRESPLTDIAVAWPAGAEVWPPVGTSIATAYRI